MSTAAAPTGKLDDLMLAMDVVDTIRHREDVLARELSLGDRDDELIERLRDIYKSQGIEVTDAVLKEGVKALKEQRFQYKAPPGGPLTAMFRLWIRRGVLMKWVAAGIVALGLGWYANEQGWLNPDARRAEQDQIDLREALPKSLAQQITDTKAASKDPEADRRITVFAAEGDAAIKAGNAAGARDAIIKLESLRADLVRTYDLIIVARPGERTGIFRVPDDQPGARNYYIIVEAYAPDGRKLRLPIRSEEDQSTKEVDIFAVRVPKATYDAVGRDKQQDGIVQDNLMARKESGKLAPGFVKPAETGMITDW
jgi:hypothetical protein